MTPQTLEQMDEKFALEFVQEKFAVDELQAFDGPSPGPEMLECVLAGIRHERERRSLSPKDLEYINVIRIHNESVKSGPITGLLNLIDRITGMEAGK